MRRLTIAFVILFSAAVLAACGDTGDHFGEFRQQPPPPISPSSLTINMPVIPGPLVQTAQLPVYVTAIHGGQAVPIGTALTNAIVVSTNCASCVHFNSASGPSKLILNSTPGAITVYYRRPRGLCKGLPPVVVTAFNHTAEPQFVTENLTPCGTNPSPSPSPSGKPTTKPSTSPSSSPTPSPTPTPVSNIVKKIVLSVSSSPVPGGNFQLAITAYNGSGKVIPPGTTVSSPINVGSNATSCISYTSGGTTGTSLQLNTTPGSVLVTYSGTCTVTTPILLTVFDLTASPQTSSFSIASTAVTVTGITLSMLALPNTASTGTYPFFIAAQDSAGAIPFGTTYINPITLSSNSCAVGFSTTPSPGSFGATITVSNSQTQVYMQFAPAADPAHCTPAGNTVIVTGAASGTSTTFSFPY